MRLKLPLLMASSLLWQAAAWGDEWVDYATAVTVTDGYLCSGELYGDSTGTDILCDAGNPFVDGDGNVGIGTASPRNSLTIVGDASVTTLNAVQLCDETGANCTDLSDGISGVSSLASLTDVSATGAVAGSILRYDGTSWTSVTDLSAALSTTTMVSGWPDAIKCSSDVYILDSASASGAKYRNVYVPYASSEKSISFDSAFLYLAHSNSGGTDCVTNTWSIAELYSNGQAFNFLGNNGAQISLTEIADVSAAAPQDGDTLTWNSTTEKWEAGSSSGGGTPSGAVMAFNLASCPSGWSEYLAARGRFIRGIDSTGTNDPDGVRALGSTQDDGVESHQHDSPLVGNNGGASNIPDQVFGAGATAASTGQNIEIIIDHGSNAAEGNEVSYRSSVNISAVSETRPINVALLYCEKD